MIWQSSKVNYMDIRLRDSVGWSSDYILKALTITLYMKWHGWTPYLYSIYLSFLFRVLVKFFHSWLILNTKHYHYWDISEPHLVVVPKFTLQNAPQRTPNFNLVMLNDTKDRISEITTTNLIKSFQVCTTVDLIETAAVWRNFFTYHLRSQSLLTRRGISQTINTVIAEAIFFSVGNFDSVISSFRRQCNIIYYWIISPILKLLDAGIIRTPCVSLCNCDGCAAQLFFLKKVRSYKWVVIVKYMLFSG